MGERVSHFSRSMAGGEVQEMKSITLIRKDGVQVMELDDSAHDKLISDLKLRGWSEPSYYCKNCGEVKMSKGLCRCFGASKEVR